MKKFEYKIYRIQSILSFKLQRNLTYIEEQLEEQLNELGKEGWELAAVNGECAYLKRELI